MNDHDSLVALVDAAVSGQLTPDQMTALNARLRTDRAARLFYLRYCQLQTDLHFTFRARKAQNQLAAQLGVADWNNLTPAPRRWTKWASLASSFALAAAILVCVWLALTPTPAPPADPVAVLTMASACQWDRDLTEGAALPPGRYQLRAGTAEITFNGGALVAVTAPAELELQDAGHAFLHAGQVVAYVPARAVGFTIETPGARVVDLGTEFGVRVAADGVTDLQVHRGLVQAQLKHATGAATHDVAAGQALQVDGAGETFRTTPFTPQRFVRTFPDPSTRPQAERTAPYNRGQITGHTVPAAPGSVRIDGDLSDWNLSGRFLSRCDEPYAETYYLEGAMMYDARCLYVSAHIGDPAPMRNMIAAGPSDLPWKGGALQLRLATDPALGWPLQGIQTRAKSKEPRPEDVSPRISHLIMWHHRPTGQAQLHLAEGFDFHNEQWNPAGFQGAYRIDADGRGYTLEYALPWALLNAAGPPPVDTPLGVNWVVQWSDRGGREWRGQLVDVLNPAVNSWKTYERGDAWGKATFLKTSGER